MAGGYTLEDKRAFAEWLVAPARVRRQYGMPTSKEAYAKARGIASKTLSRWERDEKFQPILEAARQALVRAPDPGDVAPAPWDGLKDKDRREYEAIRESLLASAQQGDPKALDLYMKHFGSHFAQEEQAARSRGLAGKSDDELVDETLALIGRPRVLAWLSA